MEIFLVALGFLLFIIFVKAKLIPNAQESNSLKDDPFFLKSRLFTPPELKYLEALQKAIGDQYKIMGKVRLADIFGVKKSKNSYRHFNQIKAKHFDYVLCDSRTYRPIAAIELDDSSHQRKSRSDRDIFVNSLCSINNFPLIRVELKHEYDIEQIKNMIDQKIKEYAPTISADIQIQVQ